MKRLDRKEELVRTDYGAYRLEYQIHEINEEDGCIYGVSIFQYQETRTIKKLFDYEIIHGFSDNLKEVKEFFDMLFKEKVFPVHLLSVADDWCLRYQNEAC